MSECEEAPQTPGKKYPMVRFRGRQITLSRFTWEDKVGPIPTGMLVCHKCDNPRCVNLDHLFLGSPLDNQRDKVAKGRHYEQAKSRCKHGHEFDAGNTYTWRGKRYCRKCRALRSAARRVTA